MNVDKNEQAAKVLAEVVAIQTEIYGRVHPRGLNTLHNLIGAYVDLTEYEQALELSKDYVARCRELNSPTLGNALLDSLKFAQKLKTTRPEAAAREYVDFRRRSAPESFKFFAAVEQVGKALLGQSKFEQAESFLIESFEGLRERGNTIPAADRSRILNKARDRVVEMYKKSGQTEEKQKWIEIDINNSEL